MAFGRKKKVVETPKVAMEVPVSEVKKLPVMKPAAEPAAVKEEVAIEALPEIAPAPTPVAEPVAEPVQEEAPTIGPSAQIISGEVLESGLFRFIVVSNKSIGEIGEILPLED